MMDTMGTRIRAARTAQNYSIQQLYELTGIPENNLIAFEEDRYVPPISMLLKLQKPLKCTIEWLLGGEKPMISCPESTSKCDEAPFSQIESDLVAMFRLLDEHDRSCAFDIITMLYERTTGKRGSSYSTYVDSSKDVN